MLYDSRTIVSTIHKPSKIAAQSMATASQKHKKETAMPWSTDLFGSIKFNPDAWSTSHTSFGHDRTWYIYVCVCVSPEWGTTRLSFHWWSWCSQLVCFFSRIGYPRIHQNLECLNWIIIPDLEWASSDWTPIDLATVVYVFLHHRLIKFLGLIWSMLIQGGDFRTLFLKKMNIQLNSISSHFIPLRHGLSPHESNHFTGRVPGFLRTELQNDRLLWHDSGNGTARESAA